MRRALPIVLLALPAAVVLAAACGGNANAPSVTMPSADAHAKLYFPANAGTVHAAYTCNDCHDPQATTFAQFDCLHCHDGAHADQAALTTTHSGIAGFELTSAGCYRCHRDGAGVNHVPFFPIASGAHAGVLCSQCHGDPANRQDPATLACASCHLQKDPALATKHTSATVPVVDYAATSAACVKCHADSQVDRGSRHPGGEGGPFGKPQHLTAGCTRCHSGFRTDKPWAASWSSIPGCTSCHANGTGGGR